jgi:Ca2+-binding EF-hand superfamily protein
MKKEYTDLIFSAFDTDKSEMVSFEEFLIGICLSSNNNLRKKLRLAFRIYG